MIWKRQTPGPLWLDPMKPSIILPQIGLAHENTKNKKNKKKHKEPQQANNIKTHKDKQTTQKRCVPPFQLHREPYDF